MTNLTKSLYALAIAAMVLGTVIACGDDETAICLGDENFIVELSPETAWVYHVTEYENDSTPLLIRTFVDTVTIEGDTVIDGNHWYLTSLAKELWANRADGFWVWKDFDDDVSQPYLMLKYPTGLGQRYPIPVEDVHPDTMHVADMMALITVPYGSFTAITYQEKNYKDTVLSLGYYVRGIGKVKEIMIPDRITKHIRRVIELQRFSTAGC